MRATRIIMTLLILIMLGCSAYAAKGARKAAPGQRPNAGQDAAKPSWWGKAPGEQPIAKGIVDSVSATSIAIKTPQGVKPFVVNEKTKVRVRGEKATIADVKAGNQVIVRFALQTNNVPLALNVMVPKPAFTGEIKEIQGGSMRVLGKDGVTRQVTLKSDAKIHSRGYIGNANDLLVGYKIAAIGDIIENQMAADTVEFTPSMAKGAVTAINGDVITVKAVRQMVIPCQASSATVVQIRPRVGPNQKGTLADVKVGSPVNIGFHKNANGPMTLLWIDVLTGV